MTANQERVLLLAFKNRLYTSCDDGEIYVGQQNVDGNEAEHVEGLQVATQAAVVNKWLQPASIKDFKPQKRLIRGMRNGARTPFAAVELVLAHEGKELLTGVRAKSVERGGGCVSEDNYRQLEIIE